MKQPIRILAILAVASLVAMSATAAPQFESLALGNGVGFNTDFAYGSAYVLVTGPDGYTQQATLTEADALSLGFESKLADGLYKWRVTMVQPIGADVRAAMSDARTLQKPARFDIESHTFTGSFRVAGGALIEPSPGLSLDDQDLATKDRDIALKAQVIATDLVVQGSTCSGFDCVNGESFGFDTLRLKENNLRIHFQDTSNTASFPSTDWRLVANDTGNGGTNHFSIEDSTVGRSPFRVEGGAPANTLVVEADGDVGVKTQNPAVDIHVVEGNTPTLRLEQDGSDGFTPQTFDVAANEANFFIRDVTNGSRLGFRIRPGAPESSIDLQGTGFVGINNSAAKVRLHVRESGTVTTPSNSAVVAFFQNTANTTDGAIMGLQSGNNANAQFWYGDTDDDNAGRIIYRHAQDVLSLWTAGTERVRIDSVGDFCVGCDDALVGADFVVGDLQGTSSSINAGDVMFTMTSSRDKKENLESVGSDDILSKIADVGVFTYDFIDGPKNKLGLIAEDFHTVFGRGEDKTINGQEVQMALWLAVQELTAQNKALIQRLDELEAQKVE
ncbi:MAG: tail fiber domain-containing protein [Acidobacteriota bacterium]